MVKKPAFFLCILWTMGCRKEKIFKNLMAESLSKEPPGKPLGEREKMCAVQIYLYPSNFSAPTDS